MNTTALVTPGSEPADPVAWEPCGDGRPDELGATLCHRCGWPLDEHAPGDPIVLQAA
jgi:hypothetical protein